MMGGGGGGGGGGGVVSSCKAIGSGTAGTAMADIKWFVFFD